MTNAAWFKSLVCMETFLQLPFFVAGGCLQPCSVTVIQHCCCLLHELLLQLQDHLCADTWTLCTCYISVARAAGSYAYAAGKGWVRIPAIVYGVSTATTVVPCLAEIATAALPLNNRLALMAIYTPYLLIPAAIAARMLFHEEAFPQKQRQLPKKRN